MNTAADALDDAKQYVDVDTGHDYDGIRELDNRLPAWWLFTLYGAVVFAGLYWAYFQTLGAGPTQLEELAKEHASFAAEAEARLAAEIERTGQDPNSVEALTALAEQPAVVERGKAIFATTCASCHRADAGGLIGPNLTDAHFVHGARADEMFKVIAHGSLQKGMPAWKPILGDSKTRDVTAYVFSLKGNPVVDGKAAEGKKL